MPDSHTNYIIIPLVSSLRLILLPCLVAAAAHGQLQPQIDSTRALLQRTRERAAAWIDSLANRITGDSTQAPKTATDRLAAVRRAWGEIRDGAGAPGIKAWELKGRLADSGLVLVDVREPSEREVSTIPGSFSPVEFAGAFRKRNSLDGKTVVAFCTIGNRSAEYAAELRDMGIDVRILEGGILAWTHEMGPLVQTVEAGDFQATRDVHVHSPDWDLAHPAYRAIW